MKRLLWFVVADVVLILAAAVAQEPPKPLEWGPQVTMIYAATKDGHKYVVPQATVVFNLVPQSGPTIKAPLNFKDYLVCRTATKNDAHERPYIVFKCGQDTYLLQGFDLIPPKDDVRSRAGTQ